MRERRQFKRLNSEDKAMLQKKEGDKQEGRLLDVSLGGMRVHLNTEIKVGTHIEGKFKIMPHTGYFYVLGKIIWVKPIPTKKNLSEVGIKFLKVSATPFSG